MKGFVGGIPLALLAVAAQAMEHGTDHSMANGIQGRDKFSEPGGTAMGGPSGPDEGDSFTSPYPANIHTNADVNEYSKDDYSIDVKHTDIFPPPPPPVPMPIGKAMAPGMGPFEASNKKRQEFATVIGGPSGDDEGQTFNMPITGNFETDVNEFNKDDHSVKVKDTEINPPPFPHPPFPHPPFSHPPFSHPPISHPPFSHPSFSHPPNVVVPPPGPAIGDMGPGFRESLPKRSEPEVDGTVIGGPGGGRFAGDIPPPVVPGGTVVGGPSGKDDGIDFDNGIHIHTHANVNEYSHDDHSVDLKHTDIYPPPPPMPFGPPFKRDWAPEEYATVMGGPSGDDGGQTFSMPTTVDVNSNVNEHHEDNHALKAESTDVHLPPPHMPWMPNHPPPSGPPMGPPSGLPMSPPEPHKAPPMGPPSGSPSGPPSGPPMSPPELHQAPPIGPPSGPPMQEEKTPACAPQVHEVVQTVTKTATHFVTQTPMDHVVKATETVYMTPKVNMGQTSAIPMSMPSKSPMTSSIAFSKIPVQVPSPSSSMSMALPSGADAMSSHKPSMSASASATPSQGTMFTGSAARLSGGIASAAAAVMGVIAFVL